MRRREVEDNIDHYLPSQDEIALAEDTLNLINLVCNCNARWKDLREMYSRLPYVRRHIVGGANRTLISVETPLRLCCIGTCRRLSAG